MSGEQLPSPGRLLLLALAMTPWIYLWTLFVEWTLPKWPGGSLVEWFFWWAND